MSMLGQLICWNPSSSQCAMAGITGSASGAGRRQVHTSPYRSTTGNVRRFSRDGIFDSGCAGDPHTPPALTETQPVIRAGDAAPVAAAEAERHAPVRADVVGHDHAAAHPVGHQRLVQQPYGGRGVADLARQGDGVPVPGEDRPVVGVERAVPGQGGRPGQGSGHTEGPSTDTRPQRPPGRRCGKACAGETNGEHRRPGTGQSHRPLVIGTRSGPGALGRRM